jgi:hypothetical protein
VNLNEINCIDVHTITIKQIKRIIGSYMYIYNNLNEKELVIECLSMNMANKSWVK